MSKVFTNIKLHIKMHNNFYENKNLRKRWTEKNYKGWNKFKRFETIGQDKDIHFFDIFLVLEKPSLVPVRPSGISPDPDISSSPLPASSVVVDMISSSPDPEPEVSPSSSSNGSRTSSSPEPDPDISSPEPAVSLDSSFAGMACTFS